VAGDGNEVFENADTSHGLIIKFFFILVIKQFDINFTV
jgi:hypothetical protein